jgi:hypothetical protein
MELNLNIETDNDAFGDFPQIELARIFREIAYKLETGISPNFFLRDIDGNKVGQVSFK